MDSRRACLWSAGVAAAALSFLLLVAPRLDAQTATTISVNPPVPIGGVCAYFGDPAALPAKWMLCDGSVVNNANSPLNGVAVPDLRQRFVMGEQNVNYDPSMGGAHTGGSTSHSHTVSVSGTTGPAPNGSFNMGSFLGFIVPLPSHTHTVSASGASSSVSHLPPHTDLHWIIRIL